MYVCIRWQFFFHINNKIIIFNIKRILIEDLIEGLFIERETATLNFR